jgi:glycosyltransferase involved in cell wall biosynthesis
VAEATIAIATKNRRDELRRALRSAVAQTVECDVLVIDDGSTDGTTEMVRAEFPAVRVQSNGAAPGYIGARNYAAEIASGRVIVSIDDDAELSARTVEQTLDDFDAPRVAAVAIPYVDVHYGDEPRQHPPDGARSYATWTYAGTAFAVRRDVFRAIGGYRTAFVRYGEETDLCLRLLDAGYVTRLGTAEPIRHYESPNRPRDAALVYGQRAALLLDAFTVPRRALPRALTLTIKQALIAAVTSRRPLTVLRGVALGLRDGVRLRGERQPVSEVVFGLKRELQRQALPVDDVLRRIRDR